MEIYCWDGDWGLPSIDIDCLYVLCFYVSSLLESALQNKNLVHPVAILSSCHTFQYDGLVREMSNFSLHGSRAKAYLKFSEGQATVKPSRVPIVHKSVSNFPILKKEDGCFLQGVCDILKYLQESDNHPDIGLEPEQYADVLALKALVTDKIHPYVLYSLWVDSRNFTEFSRPLYAKKCAFPLNFIVPGRLYKSSYDFLQVTKLNASKTTDVIGEELHLEAVDAINLLSSFLGDKEFFFGERPTSFDAMIFAYLALLVKAKLASTKLQTHVKACDNLVKFVSRILVRYFKEETKDKDSQENKQPKDTTESDYEWIFPVSFASLLMIMYATNIGLLAKLRR